MYIYQNGKLYIQKDNKLVGVEIYPNKFVLVEGTETTRSINSMALTPFEVRCKFDLANKPYIFPKEEIKTNEGEVELDVTVKPIKKSTRKSSRK